MITLAASGPAPIGHGNTGSRTFLTYATFLGIPAFSLPLMRVQGLPVGLQLICHAARDGELCAIAHWLMRGRALVFMIPSIEAGGVIEAGDLRIAQYVSALDGLVLQGGADVSPITYGEAPLRPAALH